MTLHEERSNKQNQSQWHAHLERERQQLSVSVAETLTNSSPRDEVWDDEQQIPLPKENTTLIPPLLSLQSKMLPAVRRNETEHSLTGMQTGTHPIAGPNDEQKTVSQNTSMLKRIVQRLGAPFAARGSAAPSDGNRSNQPSPSPAYERHEQPERQNTAQLPVITPTEQEVPLEWRNKRSSAIVDAVPSAYAPPYPLPQPSQSTTSKHRLAGHTTKIRLETTPISAIVRPAEVTEPIKQLPAPLSEVREPLDIVLRAMPSEKQTTYNTAPQERAVTEPIKPVTNSMRGESAVMTRGSFSGSDTFASGQRDLLVKNTNVVASSVVLVMLTANPGPVAVQYVTLQPEVGFTIHLTGPTAVKTPFNYVILLGELF